MELDNRTLFIETDRMKIFTPRIEDLDEQVLLQSSLEVMTHIGNGPRGPDEVKSSLEKAIRHYEKFNFSFGSVFEKKTCQFMGRAGLIHLAYEYDAPEIEIGYALLPDFWGKGYATELALNLIQWGFSQLSVTEIVAVARKENVKSKNVLTKVGMKYRKEIQLNGKLLDFYSVSLS